MTNIDNIPATPGTKRLNRRIHFRANRTIIAALNELKNKYGMSMSDSIRKGITIYLMAKRCEQNNQRLCFVNHETGAATEIKLI